jgi:Rhodopirellula transposase DDE domain
MATAAKGRGVEEVSPERRGRPPIEQKYPDIEQVLEELLIHEVAGDPMGEQTWVRSSLRNLSDQLGKKGYDVSGRVVGRLLRKMDYTLRLNLKTRRGAQSPQRDEQFKYIADQRQTFVALGQPIISVDTKKKEPIGNFRQAGKAWGKEPEEVNQHDFYSLAEHLAVPYGVYDVNRNAGYIYVGLSGNTPEFATDAIEMWWEEEGRILYPSAKEVLILSDGGGSNGWRSRGWKWNLQKKLADQFGLRVTVCHYPTRCSKWNPVEHRLFSHISLNWAGKPLRSLDIMLGYIRGTKTAAGLTVKAHLLAGEYPTSRKVAKRELDDLSLVPHATCPDWNYSLEPRRPDDGVQTTVGFPVDRVSSR